MGAVDFGLMILVGIFGFLCCIFGFMAGHDSAVPLLANASVVLNEQQGVIQNCEIMLVKCQANYDSLVSCNADYNLLVDKYNKQLKE